MAKRRAGTGNGADASNGSRARSRGGAGGGRLLLGFVLGAALVLVAGYVGLERPAWVRALRGDHRGTGADLDPGLPVEPPVGDPTGGDRGRTGIRAGEAAAPLKPARVAPFGSSEDVFEAGARVYRARCAGCHGTPGGRAAAVPGLRGAGLDLWRPGPGHAERVGVTGRPVGQIYDSIAEGAAPGHDFGQKLSGTQIWQVTLLLEHAGDRDGLPDPVRRILDGSTGDGRTGDGRTGDGSTGASAR